MGWRGHEKIEVFINRIRFDDIPCWFLSIIPADTVLRHMGNSILLLTGVVHQARVLQHRPASCLLPFFHRMHKCKRAFNKNADFLFRNGDLRVPKSVSAIPVAERQAPSYVKDKVSVPSSTCSRRLSGLKVWAHLVPSSSRVVLLTALSQARLSVFSRLSSISRTAHSWEETKNLVTYMDNYPCVVLSQYEKNFSDQKGNRYPGAGDD